MTQSTKPSVPTERIRRPPRVARPRHDRDQELDEGFGDEFSEAEFEARPHQVVVTPLPAENREAVRRRKIRGALTNVLFLTVPTIISAIYIYGFASDVYLVDTVFQVKTSYESGGGAGGGGKGALSFLKGGAVMGRAMDESFSVVRYIQSRNALDQLQKELDLRKAFAAPTVDGLSRLPADAGEEAFYSYYSDMVNIYFDEVSGMIVLETKAYSPDLSFQMATALAKQGEELINDFNKRSEQDLTELARNEVALAEKRLRDAELSLTTFRNEHGAIDPTATSASVNNIISTLKGQAAALEAEIRAVSDISQGDVPRLAELRNKLSGLKEQIKIEESRLTGGANTWAPILEQYNFLMIQSQLAQQSYGSALSSYEGAVLEARRQKLYVVDIVSPIMPVEPRLPNRVQSVFFTFLGALIALVVGRLVWAGVRDHMV